MAKCEEKLRSSNLLSLISALDIKNKSMKIAVIKPSSTSCLSSEKVTEFKLDMSQFNVMDIVNFFKQIGELICSNIVNVFI